MDKIRIGFVPAHREPFDDDWAIQMRRRCMDAFARIPQIEVVTPDRKLAAGGLCRDDGDADKAIKLFKDKGIQGLVIGTMTFGDEVSALSIASAFEGLPLMLFGTKEGPFTADGNRLSDSFCGTLAISSGLYRRKMPFLFAGILFPEDDIFKEKMFGFVRVCAVVTGFIGARIGLVGPRPERFETCICNEDAMMLQFKQRVVPTSLLDIMQRAKGLQAVSPELQKIIRAMKKEVDLSILDSEALKNLAGLQYALREFAQEKQLSAIGVQCWTAIQEVYGISSCYAIGRLTDAGLLTACEVDIYGALTMLVQHRASLETTRPHFIDWTIQHQEKKNVFLSWHCGNAPPSLACKGCRINLRSHSILGKPLGEKRTVGTAEFPLKPGVVTLNRMTERDGRFKMLVTRGRIIRSNETLRGSWSWVQVDDLDNLYLTLVKQGFTHHASLIHGDYTVAIKEACELLEIDTVIV
jgi:L-fucose isomerase-like protein